MKLVREHINEKFVEDSDPIKDLNIGLYIVRKFKTYEEAYEFVAKHLPLILNTKDMPDDILSVPGFEGHYINMQYFPTLKKYCDRYIHYISGLSGIDPEDFHMFLREKYPHLKSWIVDGGRQHPNPKWK